MRLVVFPEQAAVTAAVAFAALTSLPTMEIWAAPLFTLIVTLKLPPLIGSVPIDSTPLKQAGGTSLTPVIVVPPEPSAKLSEHVPPHVPVKLPFVTVGAVEGAVVVAGGVDLAKVMTAF